MALMLEPSAWFDCTRSEGPKQFKEVVMPSHDAQTSKSPQGWIGRHAEGRKQRELWQGKLARVSSRALWNRNGRSTVLGVDVPTKEPNGAETSLRTASRRL